MFSLAVVGGGASSVAFISSLAEMSATHESSFLGKISIFTDETDLGPGLAFNTSCEHHKLNTPNELMSVHAYDDRDFVVWLNKSIKKARKSTNYLPRNIYGQYLEERMSAAITGLENNGINVQVINSPANKARLIGDRVGIKSKKSDWITPDAIVYAPGFPGLTNFPDLIDSKAFKPKSVYRRNHLTLESHAPIAIMGSGLTAIDIILQILNSDFEGRIDCYSRSGLLPTVQHANGQNNIITEFLSFDNILTHHNRNKSLTLKDLISFVKRDLAHYPNHELSLLKEIDPATDHTLLLKSLIEKAESGQLPLQALLQNTR